MCDHSAILVIKLRVMRMKIHFEIDGQEDFFILEGDDIIDIAKELSIEEDKRGLHEEKNNMWSELL